MDGSTGPGDGQSGMLDRSGSTDRSEGAREAFALLGHEVRLNILLALLEDWRAARTEPRSYSELMRAVGMADSGKFNYHLSRLRGVYVRKVEDGYVPTASATALYRAVLATKPACDNVETSFRVDEPCPDCDGPLRATYERSFLSVACPECGTLAADFTYSFPANGIDGRTDEAVVDAVSRRVAHHVALARSGQCPFCAGTTTTALEPDGDAETHDVEMTCDTCSLVIGVDALYAVALVPRVTAALVALSVPVEAARTWDIPTPTTRVRSRDPLTVALDVEVDAGTATVVIDENLTVREVSVDGEPVESP